MMPKRKPKVWEKSVASRLLSIVLSLSAGVVIGVAAVAAKAQSRHDHDQQWIRQTIREKDRQALEKHYGMPVEIVRRPRTVHRERHYYDRWREARRDERDRHHHGHEHHRETRVYGVVMRRAGFSERDATSHVECFPPVVGRSNERSSQDEAWGDAQLDWANAVRWLYGERFMDLRNANPIRRQCAPSTVKESFVGKITQGVRETVTGNADVASRWRCQVQAGPCQAPIDGDPDIKSDAAKGQR